MSEPIVFVVDITPINEDDMFRTQAAVQRVVRELVEDGVQVKGFHAAIGPSRERVSEVFTNA